MTTDDGQGPLQGTAHTAVNGTETVPALMEFTTVLNPHNR